MNYLQQLEPLGKRTELICTPNVIYNLHILHYDISYRIKLYRNEQYKKINIKVHSEFLIKRMMLQFVLVVHQNNKE